MNLCELTETEFRNFLDHHPLKTFLQTPEIAHLREKSGWKIYYVGLKENNTILAATMMLSSGKFFKKQVFYAPRGVLIDFENQKLVTIFFKELKKFIQNHQGYVFKMDPYYERIERDINGNPVENGFQHQYTIDFLKRLGFRLLSNSEQAKWMYALDIENKTIEDLKKDFRPSTRNVLNKVLKSNIKVRELTYEELHLFKKVTEETSERKQFQDKSLSYYQEMYQLFKPLNQIRFLIAELNLADYISFLETEKKSIQSKLNMSGNEKASDKKIKEYETSLQSIEKKLTEANQILSEVGPVLILSAGMFILYGDEIVYLMSGNYKKYMNFNAQYLIQWEMLNYAVEHHYKRYNFYGISGNFDKSDKDYGIYDFKKGFGGYVIELIGELELPISSFYYIHTLLSHIKKKRR